MLATRKSWWLVAILVLFLIVCSGTPVSGTKPPSVLKVTVPDYNVTTADNLDYVDIPGGSILLVEGKPRVPYYFVSVDYPKGYRIQEITLAERSGLVTASGLKLPTVVMWPLSFPGSQSSPAGNENWYPKENYKWRVWDNPDGSTTLIIMIYPFYYNSETTNVEFYKNYCFKIEYIISNVEVTALSLGKDNYAPGDKVRVDIWLKNSGETQDVVVGTVIKQYGSDEIVAGLPLRTLKNLAGEASVTAEWNSSGIAEGYYYAEVTLADTSGNVLDRKTVGFSMYVSGAGEEKQPQYQF